MDKERIKQSLIDLEVHIIDEATVNHDEFLTEQFVDSDDIDDVDDQSHRVSNIELSAALDEQIGAHEEHLKTIRETSFEPTDVVQPGAVIRVNGRHMIVAVSKPRFKIDGHNYIGISTDAPIYSELEGKKAGDEFTFNGRTFKIDSVH